MNRYTLYFLGLFLGAVCGVSASMGTMPSLDDYGVVSEKGSRLAKDATLSGLYNRTLADLSELQGAAEMVRELHALADWAGLKKGKAPRHFHKRLSTLKKTVRQTEWLTDEQKQLVASLIDRLGKKKQRHATEAAVFGSLTAAVVVACLSAMVVAKMRKNKEAGYGGGMDPYKKGSTHSSFGEGPSGGMGTPLGQGGEQAYQLNPFAGSSGGLGNGPSASPNAAPQATVFGLQASDYVEVPTGAQPQDLPNAPYGPVQQFPVGVPLANPLGS
ncbi:MAG: hypothetical protein WCJ17_00565 [bacterium]